MVMVMLGILLYIHPLEGLFFHESCCVNECLLAKSVAQLTLTKMHDQRLVSLQVRFEDLGSVTWASAKEHAIMEYHCSCAK